MAFGIIRARNLSAGDIAATDKHNARRYSSEKDYPININSNGTYEARYTTEIHENYLYKEDITLQEAIAIRLKQNHVKGIRKNSNVAIEYVCTINDKKAWDSYSFSGFTSNTKKWLEKRHGKHSVVATYEHYDESNPHAHFIVVPIREKEVFWKNAKSAGKRKEVRLNTREFTGGRDKLRKLQDDYFEYLVGRYGEGKDNKFRLPLYRGTKIEHQQKEYSFQTNHEISILRDKIKNSVDEVKKLELGLKIAKKQAQMLNKEKEYEEKKKVHQDKTKRNWRSKGTAENPTIFHTEKETKKKKGLSR